MKLSIVGFGNMARAIVKGLLKNKTFQISVSSPKLAAAINQDGIQTYASNISCITNAEVIILAVKPAQMAALLKEISPHIPNNALIISIAAGLKIAFLEKQLPLNTPIVRAMPNIAAAVGQSATPLYHNQAVTSAQQTVAKTIFESIGIVTFTHCEQAIDTFTALSGSGPAYVFLFMDALAHAAILLGLPEDIAKSFTLQTVQGAVNLALQEQRSFSELQQKVTSKAGTTAAAIDVFTKNHFRQLVFDAMLAAQNRAYELGE